MNNVIIRQEHQSDYEQVYDVIKKAFENQEHSDKDEHNLVSRLRKSEAFVPKLSLVAEIDGKVVGHILFTEITIGGKVALALAPLAVLPNYQGLKIGSKLINFGHEMAREMDYKAVVLLGHEKYYPRFGYNRASLYDIMAPFDVPDECFMAIELKNNSLDSFNGIVQYAPEFFQA